MKENDGSKNDGSRLKMVCTFLTAFAMGMACMYSLRPDPMMIKSINTPDTAPVLHTDTAHLRARSENREEQGQLCLDDVLRNAPVDWATVPEKGAIASTAELLKSIAWSRSECTHHNNNNALIPCADDNDKCCFFVGTSGKRYPAIPNWGVEWSIATAIKNHVVKNRMTKTLEIGMAQGSTAFQILAAHKTLSINGMHTNVQPAPIEEFDGISPMAMKSTGLYHYSRLLGFKSQDVLPLLSQCEPASFDLVLVDGYHSFEVTLLDMYYANTLLKVNGTLLVDDTVVGWKNVKKAATFWTSNHNGYKTCAPELHRVVSRRQLCLQKTGPSWEDKDKFVDF